MPSDSTLTCTTKGEWLELAPAGSWTTGRSAALEDSVAAAMPQVSTARKISVNMAGVRELDTLGAWLLERLVRRGPRKPEVQIIGLPDRYRGLLDQVKRVNLQSAEPPANKNKLLAIFESIGQSSFALSTEVITFLEMLAAVSFAIARLLSRPWHFRLISAVNHVYRVGWQSIPIMLLITFLIGCIIAQQGIFHFRKFGADAYVVDMVGILVLRELGVLIVAIMMAGRSGSAYTAELGSMKMREEIDALRMMGFDPVEVLILPRIVALIVALPILAFLGSMAALFGGGLVAWLYGDMNPEIFIARLREAVSVTHFEVGMIKAPFMALVIGVVACGEGLRVKGSAASLGLQTTNSVVKSIFLVIVLDGVFAIFFASIGM
ncbi:MAG TPA: ABC transporter permease [Xanthobacteraceae bacterium]|nr:ABC transporter permease [Xanthobacteraceae bacterium]